MLLEVTGQSLQQSLPERCFTVSKELPEPTVDTHYKERFASDLLARGIRKLANGKPLAFVCVGAPSSTGDSVGPFVGWFLERSGFKKAKVYGTLEFPVHATNMHNLQISNGVFVVAVDAAIGVRPGTIRLYNEPLKPGAGFNKDLPLIGDAHILVCTANMPSLLWFASLDTVVRAAELVAVAIERSVD